MKKVLLICCILVVLLVLGIFFYCYYSFEDEKIYEGEITPATDEEIYEGEITLATVDSDGNTTFISGNKAAYDYFSPFQFTVKPNEYSGNNSNEETITYERACKIASDEIGEKFGPTWNEKEEHRKPVVYDYKDGYVFIVSFHPTEPYVLTYIGVVILNKYTGEILFCNLI